MQTTTTARGAPAFTAALASFALDGCGSASSGSGPGAGTGNGSGPGMMASAGYRFSNLSCRIPENLPDPTVSVMLGDQGMTQMMGDTAPLGARMMLRSSPRQFAAGPVTLVVTNRGWRTHELVVLPLAVGGQRVPGSGGKVDEKGSLADASTSCGSGKGEGIRAGSAGWVTRKLVPERYELVWNLRNHHADGMHQEIVVT